MCGRLRVGKNFFHASSRWSVQPCVRPVSAVHMTAGQLLDTTAPDRRDDPELGQVRTNGIDDGRLLANEQMPRAMKCQTALLLGGLDRHKPHVWPRYGFANRFRVSRTGLVSFDGRLHVGRLHQPYGVTERLELARPIM